MAFDLLYVHHGASSLLAQLAILLLILLLSHSVHIHMDALFHRWLSHFSQRNKFLAFQRMASSVLDKLLKPILLVFVDVLLIVLCATDLSKLCLVLLAKFKLIQGLRQDIVLFDHERLSWVASTRSIFCLEVVVTLLLQFGVRVGIATRMTLHYVLMGSCNIMSFLPLRLQLRVESDTILSCASKPNIDALESVQILVQGMPMNFTSICR